MADEIRVTQSKFEELSARLQHLETTARIEVAAAIKTAKEFGDLSENAEYAAAKDAQVRLEMEIAKLSETLVHIKIIDEASITTDTVSLGTIASVEKGGKIVQYKIVSSMEVSSKENKISEQSPIGKALLGHKKGDTVYAVTPGGQLKLKILEITK